jgi:hypothetical protein
VEDANKDHLFLRHNDYGRRFTSSVACIAQVLCRRRPREFRAMVLTLRAYRGPEDIQPQNRFWLQVTRKMPRCWKPTISPRLYVLRRSS